MTADEERQTAINWAYDHAPWGALPRDAQDPNNGRTCVACGTALRAGARASHECLGIQGAALEHVKRQNDQILADLGEARQLHVVSIQDRVRLGGVNAALRAERDDLRAAVDAWTVARASLADAAPGTAINIMRAAEQGLYDAVRKETR